MTDPGYTERRRWSDSHLDKVKCVLGRKFIAVSNYKMDTQFAIDLYVPNLQFAVRLRRLKYRNYKDFTIRTTAPNGYKSEYDKLLADTAPDFMFYGFIDSDDEILAGYLIDLKDWKRAVESGEVSPVIKKNKDGSEFAIFSLDKDYAEQVV